MAQNRFEESFDMVEGALNQSKQCW